MSKDYKSYAVYLAEIISHDIILTKQEAVKNYLYNISDFKRQISGILLPRNVADVQEMVIGANKFGVSIFPISKGKNWGLGSRLPAGLGDVYIMDLGIYMDRIIELDQLEGYTTIEPGVTQGQLSNELRSIDAQYVIDSTGSTPDSSIIGSICDSGIGFNRLRKFDLCELTVVLGSGEVITVSSSSRELAGKNNSKPLTAELFVQTNFGIIVSARIKLLPLSNKRELFILLIKNNEDLGKCMKILGREMEQGSISCIPHAFNRRRLTLSSENSFVRFVTNKFPWVMIGQLKGSRPLITAQKKHLKRLVSKISIPLFVGNATISILNTVFSAIRYQAGVTAIHTIRELFGIYGGTPSYLSQSSLLALNVKKYGCDMIEVDQLRLGLLFNTVRIENNVQSVSDLLALVAGAERELEEELPHTLMLISPDVIANAVLFFFDKLHDVKKRKVHEVHRQLIELGLEKSMSPYKLDVGNMDLRRMDDLSAKYINRLKEIFDSRNVIAPGRYGIPYD
ncbi:MAG: FAD-binding oxidoreductase [Candidatus Electrothrix sp. AR4]|nr:FAD-binding oxidoreductase [Candidatus Electrothrix sp. AR4]